jgi:hypothetical protein
VDPADRAVPAVLRNLPAALVAAIMHLVLPVKVDPAVPADSVALPQNP